MSRLLITLLLTAYGMSASAQDTKEFYFSQLNTSSGLSSNSVRSVQQDSIGFIWSLNGNTLQRYDGQRLLTFRHELNNPNSLPEGVLYNLRIDNKNRLWIIYGNFQAGYFDAITFRFYKVKINASKEQLHKAGGGIFTGSNGDVILIAMNKFMFTYNEKAREFDEKYNRFKLPKDILPLSFDEGKYDHNYWITYGKGVMKYNIKQNTLSYPGHNIDNDPYVDALANYETVLHFYIDKNKKCWFSWLARNRILYKMLRSGN
jgi:ligand-binding sensor domain-containing protein